MKVLQIIDSLDTGGAEKLILESLPIYRKNGIEMDVAVLKDENYPFMVELSKMNICKIHILGSGSVYNPKHIFKISKLLSLYDIAHVHLFPAQYWVVLAKLWSSAKTKLVFTEHNTTNTRIQHSLFSIIDRLFYKNYDIIVAITSDIKKILKRHTKLNKDKILTVENGVNVEKIYNAKAISKLEFFREEGLNVVVQVSAFRPQKDQSTLIRSMTMLPNSFVLLLVGDGPLKLDNQNLVKELSLDPRVIFTGNRSDVPQILKMADVIVLSSNYEGMSLSSIEGMASGRPFIASDVPGLSNIVNGAGLLFDQGNAEQLASHIENLVQDRKFNEETVENCLKRARLFGLNTMVIKYIKLYNSLA